MGRARARARYDLTSSSCASLAVPARFSATAALSASAASSMLATISFASCSSAAVSTLPRRFVLGAKIALISSSP